VALIESDESKVIVDKGGYLRIYVREFREVLAELADRFFGKPSKALTLVGITGTNGKTSCADLLLQIWTSAGKAAASLGTLGWKVGDGEFHPTGLTTLDVIENHRMLSRFVQSGVTHVVMEVSSHGIDQGRIDGLRFDARALSNISRDHLDYHGDMESYANTKLSFVNTATSNVVVNLDDQRVQAALAAGNMPAVKTFSASGLKADLFVTQARYTENGISVDLVFEGEALSWSLSLIGGFNVENVLLVYLLATTLGQKIGSESLSKLKPVSGRLQAVECNHSIYVDYAHTPDALEKSLMALAQHFGSSVVLVFGCGGDRDKGKRPQMAAIAEKYASKIYVTSDNPRTENPDFIIDDICQGFTSLQNVVVEVDRATAIKQAVSDLAGEVLLVAGKGHEDYQEINGERHAFSDYEQVLRSVA